MLVIANRPPALVASNCGLEKPCESHPPLCISELLYLCDVFQRICSALASEYSDRLVHVSPHMTRRPPSGHHTSILVSATTSSTTIHHYFPLLLSTTTIHHYYPLLLSTYYCNHNCPPTHCSPHIHRLRLPQVADVLNYSNLFDE